MSTSTKLDEVQEVFNRFDGDGDGLISSTELAGSDSSADDISRLMTELDTENNGFINLAEFTSFFKSTATVDDGEAESGLKDAFDLYDKNGNGLISAAELHQVLIKLGEHCSVADCEKMIESVDSDGDGNVNFDEFKKMMAAGSKRNAA